MKSTRTYLTHLDSKIDKLSYEEKKERAKSIDPVPPPYKITVYVCKCGRVSLHSFRAGHIMLYPNEFGLPNCPYNEPPRPVIYEVNQQTYLQIIGEYENE